MNNEIYFLFSYEGQEGGRPYWNNESFVTSKSVDFHPIESKFFLNMLVNLLSTLLGRKIMVAADRSVKKWAGFLERRAAKFWGHISVTWESDVFQGEKEEREKQEESWRIAKKWAFLEISFSSPFFV